MKMLPVFLCHLVSKEKATLSSNKNPTAFIGFGFSKITSLLFQLDLLQQHYYS